jgi:purine nucleosidase
MPRKIIIDTDPGQDDAVAILLALANQMEIDLLGIVAVAGNVPLALTHKNARKVLELAARPAIPVYAGCSRPLMRTAISAAHVHGKTGMDGPTLPEPSIPVQAKHGVDYLIDTIREAPLRTITICVLGPLTNIAMALIKAPDIAERIAEIVLMGGAYFEGGNITPSAEFNIFCDPEAAAVVLSSAVPKTIVPLDVTHQLLITQPRLQGILDIDRRCSRAVHEMLGFSERFDLAKYGWEGAPLHDPCVIAYLLKPGAFSGRNINVSVETSSNLTLGMTVADWWSVSDRPANALYLRGIDSDVVYNLIVDGLRRLP